MYNQKFIKTLLIIQVVLSVAMFTGYYFVYGNIKSNSEKAAALAIDISSQQKKQTYLKSTKEIIDSISPHMEIIDGTIVPKDGDIAFIEGLETLARDNNIAISINSIDVEDTLGASAGLVILKASVQADGRWADTYTFIEKLESMPYKTKIGQYTLVNNAKDTWHSTFEVRVLKYK